MSRAITQGLLLSGFMLVTLIGGTPASSGADEQKDVRYTNRLSDSNNPYLLLHADNPVDWYPWGREAIATARAQGKPIFVSVGYSTCYWCHVAERTLYSDPRIATLMNEWFVNVKVDREQRPDVDEVYMLARHLITGDGGWPNNVFLTPDLKPFYAGSYFPPATDELGRPGFPEVLRAIHRAWISRRDEVLAFADQVHAQMQAVQEEMGGSEEVPISPAEWLAEARRGFLDRFDAQHGGTHSIRDGTKFPQAPTLQLLLADYRLNGGRAVLDALMKTLDAMAYGGIYDHLAGGFHRYSTERTWSVPHFEKMLYDNVQLLQIYAEAYEVTSTPLYRHVAEDVAAYLSEEMMAPEGGFYTAQDSQVEGVEGASYRWRRADIEDAIGTEAAKRFFLVYDLIPVPELPGSTGDEAGNVGGVLRVRLPIERTLRRAGVADPLAMLAALDPLRGGLLALRNARPQPLRDEKLNVDLNGLAIEAFVASGRALGEPRHIELAERAAERIWAVAYEPSSGALKHQFFRGRVQTEGFLGDYALLARGLLALHGVGGEQRWLDRALVLADAIIKRFMRPDGGLAMTPGESDLLTPVESTGDSVYPSGTSATLDLLLRVSELGANERYSRAAGRILRHYSAQLERSPSDWVTSVLAVNASGVGNALRMALAPGVTDAPGQGARPSTGFRAPQTADHVRISAEARDEPDGDAIVVTLAIEDGYHVNANPATLDYLIATTLELEGLAPEWIRYPDPTTFKPAFTEQALQVYEGEARLLAWFRDGALDGLSVIEGTVRVQACNAEVCLPPSDLPVSISLSGP